MKYISLTPRPAQIISLPVWFADRVEVKTDNCTIPRGVWMVCDEKFIRGLVVKLEKSQDAEQCERIQVVLDVLQTEDEEQVQ